MTPVARTSSLFFLIGSAWVAYLATLAPSLQYRDSPEFINTVFALGISHPAGFPSYNLLAKAFTFLPTGSVAFRINLFSAFCALITLFILFRVAGLLLDTLIPQAKDSPWIHWASWVITGILAVTPPFWKQSLVSEVYTLHTAFTGALFWLLLLWRQHNDVRFLYGAGLLYGLSSGNHATAGFYLPAILILFFLWCRNRPVVHLSRCVALFLVGFSVYAYLPVRSMTEPSFDWGNPETVEGFLFQVTDQKDANYHFQGLKSGGASSQSGFLPEGPDLAEQATSLLSKNGSRLGSMVLNLGRDLIRDLSIVGLLGFIGGGILCFQRSRPLFFFFAVIISINVLFFYSWRNESYLPTYLIALLFTALALGWMFNRLAPQAGKVSTTRQPLAFWAVLSLVLLVFWQGARNAPLLDRSEDVIPEMLPRQWYLAIDNHALFVPALSWFHYYYHQDVQRLRDDVTAVNVWDLLSPNPPDQMTRRRYPHLSLPDAAEYDFKSHENIAAYARDFFERNRGDMPILMEQNRTFYEQTLWAPLFQPHRNMLLKYDPDGGSVSGCDQWKEFKAVIDEDLKRPGAGRDLDWVNVPQFLVISWALYARDTERYAVEAEALGFLREKFGFSQPRWQRLWIENRLNTGHPEEARLALAELETRAPGHWMAEIARSALLEREGKLEAAVQSLQTAARENPVAFLPQRELARIYHKMGRAPEAEEALQRARARMQNLRQLGQLRAVIAGKSVAQPQQSLSCFSHNPLS